MNFKRIGETFLVFLRLGCFSFGGPVAHLGYFQEIFVTRRKWVTQSHFADLVALSHFLPGPSSSQVGYAIGVERAGIIGGLAAWIGFTLPSALMMYAVAMTVLYPGELSNAGWLQGLKAAAVAVVALASLQMFVLLAPDTRRKILVGVTGVLAFVLRDTIAQAWVLLIGAAAGLFALPREAPTELESTQCTNPISKRAAVIALALFVASLLVTWTPWALFAQCGSLVFGGGHVVLPLLETRFVLTNLVDENTFLAGYGVAQAIPGPLFTFATFLGATCDLHISPALGALVSTISIFIPGLLLMTAALPFWNTLKNRAWARGMLSGVNAAVVGLLIAALIGSIAPALVIRPFGSIVIGPTTIMILIYLVAFALLRRKSIPVPAIVALCALVGWLLL
ncbi:MAG: chromate efflux transporter [Planctomycetota bacterium]|nr:MAG: chromate efflux transporter [Planctomycetota bacterium]